MGPDNRMTQVTTLLRQTRDNKQIPLTTMEQATRIPLQYLQALEGEGPSHLLAERMYLIPYLRTYAHELGLNPSAVVNQFVAEIEDEPVTERRLKERVQSARPQSSTHFTSGGVYLVLLVFVFFLASRQFHRDQPQVADQQVTTAAQILTEKQAAIAIPAAAIPAPAEQLQPIEARPLENLGQTETTKKQSSLQLIEARSLENTVPTETPEKQPSLQRISTTVPKQQKQVPQNRREVTTPPSPTLQGPFELRLTATAPEVWVQGAIDGGPVRRVRLQQGQTITWVAQRRHVVSVDDAGGVRASLNGRALPRLGASGRSRRNIAIP